MLIKAGNQTLPEYYFTPVDQTRVNVASSNDPYLITQTLGIGIYAAEFLFSVKYGQTGAFGGIVLGINFSGTAGSNANANTASAVSQNNPTIVINLSGWSVSQSVGNTQGQTFLLPYCLNVTAPGVLTVPWGQFSVGAGTNATVTMYAGSYIKIRQLA
jgi:hypothetical protein